MRERAFTQQATEADIAEMQRELAASLRAGAIGFSTSRTSAHKTMDGGPVASFVADSDEINALASVLGELDAGIFQLAASISDVETQEAIAEIAAISRRPVHVALVQSIRAPAGQWRDNLAYLDSMALRGRHVVGQVHVRQVSNVSGFRVGLPFDALPLWASLRQQPLDAQRAAFEDPERRRALVEQAMYGFEDDASNVVAEVSSRRPDFENVLVLESPLGPNPSVAQIAAQRQCTPVDVMIDLSLANNFDQYFLHPFANANLDDVYEIFSHPRTVLAASDAGAHVSQIIESCAPTFLLGYWVRDREALSLEEAVRLITSRPAAEFGFTDRGRIAEGMCADLVVFDQHTVAPQLPTLANDLPSGGKRLVQRAEGIRATIVNGEILLDDGQFSAARPGQLLRSSL